MKKLLLLSVALIATSCASNDDDTTPGTVAEDCNCDRVVQANTYNVVGTPQSPAMNYYTVYTTINDCTDIQKQKNHTTTVASSIPKIGQCR
jgi:hypothetical protein